VGDATRPDDVPIPRTDDELRAFVKAAQGGDASTLPALRKLLRNPAAVRLFGGELAGIAEMAFVNAMAGDNLGFREAAVRKLELLRSDLLGPDPTPVERLLVERVVACWLQVQDAEIRYAQNAGKLTMTQGDYHQRRMNTANRRFLAAVRTLATVRKLAVPVLQVNIARRQVNVAAPSSVATQDCT
jgi:hypothetical protein